MLVEVVGTYAAADGSFERGRVVFKPMVHASHEAATSTVFTLAPVSASLSDQGHFSVSLAASDDPGWHLDGPLPYKVLERLTGSQRSYYVYIYGPGPVDLATLEHHDALDLVLPGPSTMALGRRRRR
jgi:hypothetical protein